MAANESKRSIPWRNPAPTNRTPPLNIEAPKKPSKEKRRVSASRVPALQRDQARQDHHPPLSGTHLLPVP